MISTLKSFKKCHTAITLYEKFMFNRINQNLQRLIIKNCFENKKKKLKIFFSTCFIIMFNFNDF